MFDNIEKPIPGDQVPSPPIPPQPATKPSEPVVEAPPPAGENPHMDLPLTPKLPSPTSKLKIVLGSLASLVLLAGIGYGGWYVYQNYILGDQPVDEQPVMVEGEEPEPQIPEEPTATIETNHYTFDEYFNQAGKNISLSGFIDIDQEQNTARGSIHHVNFLQSEDQENLSEFFLIEQANDLMLFKYFVASLNPEAGEIDEKESMYGDLILSEWQGVFPKFGEGYQAVMDNGIVFEEFEFSTEISVVDSTHPIMRAKYVRTGNDVTMALYDASRKQKNSSMDFSALLVIEDFTDFVPNPEDFPGPSGVIILEPAESEDEIRVAITFVIQSALAQYHSAENHYPQSEEFILSESLKLCDSGFVDISNSCQFEYLNPLPQDPGNNSITYKSFLDEWYILKYELDEDVTTGGVNLSAGINLQTPKGDFAYSQSDQDIDGDGLSDVLEAENGTDINESDSDFRA